MKNLHDIAPKSKTFGSWIIDEEYIWNNATLVNSMALFTAALKNLEEMQITAGNIKTWQYDYVFDNKTYDVIDNDK